MNQPPLPQRNLQVPPGTTAQIGTKEALDLAFDMGRKAGFRECREDMARVLDAIADGMHGTTYHIPIYRSTPFSAKPTGERICAERPCTVELTIEQVAAVRLLLCGPRERRA